MKLHRVIIVTALHCPNLGTRSEVGGESHAPVTLPPVGPYSKSLQVVVNRKFLAPTGSRIPDRVILPTTVQTSEMVAWLAT
jgi:hypothetical protein